MLKCDVIVPVYNAFDCVVACVESVLKNTNFKKAHLILINDKSSDERIAPMLKNFVKKNPGKITVLSNEKNLGFVGTVNRGMKYSKNDVLLLNSDTEVAEGWLDRIEKCAYSDESIATVTPLSNNATLASVPKIFYRNELPKGYSLAQMAELVKESSLRDYPEIPTAHGFCMYIKREALEVVGYFDEENFGKGYGEENDFSFRCFEYGYRNVLCDDVYVLHKESQSFLGEKKDHGEALAKKHPELKDGLDRWCEMRDIRRIGDNLALAMGVRDDRPNILMVVHDFSNIDSNVGGTTLHILDLIKELRDKYNFHVLAPEGGVYKLHSFFKDSDLVSAVYEKPFLIEQISLYSSRYEQMLKEIIGVFKISFVHVHHMKGHFFNVIDVCKEKKIKYALSLHDMYLIYPIASMVDRKVKDELDPPIRLDIWQKACGRLLENAEVVIAPSEFAKNRYREVYGKQRIKVVGHGISVVKHEARNILGDEKNIAFVGAVFPHKGSWIMEKLADEIKSGDRIKMHLFGETTADMRRKKLFIDHGKYKRSELADLLRDNKIDLVCVFSLAPETYAYTVDEVVASGVPILTFDIGAAMERIEENGLGWVMEYTDNSKKIYKKIKCILEDKKGYEEIIENIKAYKIRGTREMALQYKKIYDQDVKKAKVIFKEAQKLMLEANFVQNVITEYSSNNFTDDYFAIINSMKWRVISKIKVPRGTKKMVKKIYHIVKE